MGIARKVKIFQGSDESVEKKINQWLAENANEKELIDIKIASAGNGATTIRETYIIIYKDKFL